MTENELPHKPAGAAHQTWRAKKVWLLSAAAIVVAIGVVVTLYSTGTMLTWDGTYSGIVRPSGQAGSVSVLNKPEGGVVLVLNAPDLKGGSCSIGFKRNGRRMVTGFPETCAGLDGVYMITSGRLTIEGENLSASIDFLPQVRAREDDFSRAATLDFLGTRSTGVGVPLPAIFGGRASPAAAPASTASNLPSDAPAASSGLVSACLTKGSECRSACPRSGPPKPNMTGAEKSTWQTAFDAQKRCRDECEATEAACMQGKDVSASPAAMQGQGLSQQQIIEVVTARSRGVRRRCWDSRLNDKRTTANIQAAVGVARDGSVSNVTTTGDDPEVAACLEREIRAWKFPATSSPSSVNIPFRFVLGQDAPATVTPSTTSAAAAACEPPCLDCTGDCMVSDLGSDACNAKCYRAIADCCQKAGTTAKPNQCGCR